MVVNLKIVSSPHPPPVHYKRPFVNFICHGISVGRDHKAASLSQYLRLTKLYPRAEGGLLARLFIYLFIFPEMNPMCLPRVEGRDRMEAIKYKEPFLKRKGRGRACRTKLLLEDLGFQFGIFSHSRFQICIIKPRTRER